MKRSSYLKWLISPKYGNHPNLFSYVAVQKGVRKFFLKFLKNMCRVLSGLGGAQHFFQQMHVFFNAFIFFQQAFYGAAGMDDGGVVSPAKGTANIGE